MNVVDEMIADIVTRRKNILMSQDALKFAEARLAVVLDKGVKFLATGVTQE